MPTQIIVADGKFAAQIKKSPETKTVLTVGGESFFLPFLPSFLELRPNTVWPTQWYRQALEGDLSQWLLNISEIPSVNVQICVVSQSPDHISLAERKLQESISKSPPPEYQCTYLGCFIWSLWSQQHCGSADSNFTKGVHPNIASRIISLRMNIGIEV